MKITISLETKYSGILEEHIDIEKAIFEAVANAVETSGLIMTSDSLIKDDKGTIGFYEVDFDDFIHECGWCGKEFESDGNLCPHCGNYN